MKLKVTYQQYGLVKADIFESAGLFSLGNDLNSRGVYDQDFIKVEKVLEADEENTFDETINPDPQ